MTRPAQPAVAVRHAQAPGRVRIIGGQWKRTPIPLPVVPGLRPTPDRVRETVFNWVGHLRPELLAGAQRPHPNPPPPAGEGWGGGEPPRASAALDLFAGSGALGFEAASRGVARVTLVERDARALAALRALRDKLHAEQVEVVAGDALAAAARLPAASFDLIFLDPPFDSGLLAPALAASVRLLAPDGLIYAESGAPLADSTLAPLGLRLLRNDRAGQVFFHLLARREG